MSKKTKDDRTIKEKYKNYYDQALSEAMIVGGKVLTFDEWLMKLPDPEASS